MANGLKTALLLGLLSGLLLVHRRTGIGGANGLVIAFVFAAVMNFGSYWFSDKIVLRMYRAQEVGPGHPLYQIVRAARAAGAACRCRRSTSSRTTRRTRSRPAATRSTPPSRPPQGILQVLSERELEGVIAHELAHVKHRDILISSVAATIAAAIMMVGADGACTPGCSADGRRRTRQRTNPIALLAMIILAPIAAMLIQAAISRSREFAADAGGARIAGQSLRAGRCAAEDRRGVEAGAARRQPGDGAHVHRQAVLRRRADVALQHPPADRGAHSRPARRHPVSIRLPRLSRLSLSAVNAARRAGEAPSSRFALPSLSQSLTRRTVGHGPTGSVSCSSEPQQIRQWRAHVEDFDIPQNKLAESAERVVDRALEEARRREHALLTNEHLCLAFAQVEWDMFGQVMRDLSLNPHEILQALEEHLQLLPSVAGTRPPRGAVDQAAVQARAAARQPIAAATSVEATDLFSAIFEETQGIPVSIIRRHGIEPEALVSRLATRMRDNELREERLKKRFELPPFLKHFATNLNQLARQDKIPPVFGRDAEMDQVLEILCHRERANSVLLLGEPGVGKTAIAEGLARRIEFEPEKVPVAAARLPDRQPADEHDGGRDDAARACSRIGSRTSSARSRSGRT